MENRLHCISFNLDVMEIVCRKMVLKIRYYVSIKYAKCSKRKNLGEGLAHFQALFAKSRSIFGAGYALDGVNSSPYFKQNLILNQLS